jgi:hypothetical protein
MLASCMAGFVECGILAHSSKMQRTVMPIAAHTLDLPGDRRRVRKVFGPAARSSA